MSAIYTAVLRDGRLEWEGDAPALPAGTRVRVTVAELPPTPPVNAALSALERIAARGGATEFPHDLVAWQREIRQDRPLPGRDEE